MKNGERKKIDAEAQSLPAAMKKSHSEEKNITAQELWKTYNEKPRRHNPGDMEFI
jgi:hypothetical protein